MKEITNLILLAGQSDNPNAAAAKTELAKFENADIIAAAIKVAEQRHEYRADKNAKAKDMNILLPYLHRASKALNSVVLVFKNEDGTPRSDADFSALIDRLGINPMVFLSGSFSMEVEGMAMLSKIVDINELEDLTKGMDEIDKLVSKYKN
jgi:hypothetical protein